MNKYHNRKVKSADGRIFDSAKEFKRYKELSLLQRTGQIQDLKCQIPFELIPAQRGENGRVIERAVTYKADFVYTENGKTVVEDTKGFKTPEYIIKRKLMLFRHGIQIKEST